MDSSVPNCIGQNVIQAARIEPITLPNHVFASQVFCQKLSAHSEFKKKLISKQLGKVSLAKNRGDTELMWLGRRRDTFPKKDYLEFQRDTAKYDFIPIQSYQKSDETRKEIYLLADRLAKQSKHGELYSLFVNNPRNRFHDFRNLVQNHIKNGRLKFVRIQAAAAKHRGVPFELEHDNSRSYVYLDYSLTKSLKQRNGALREIIPNALLYMNSRKDVYRGFLSFCASENYGLALYTENKEIVVDLLKVVRRYENKIKFQPKHGYH